jgi:prevent-host-death family protein
MAGKFNVSTDIRSLTDFKRHTNELTKQMKQTGRPLVLTVNGKAEFVVQDAASYQATIEAAERVLIVEGIQRGLEQMERGEGVDAKEFSKAFRARHKIRPENGAEPDGV